MFMLEHLSDHTLTTINNILTPLGMQGFIFLFCGLIPWGGESDDN